MKLLLQKIAAVLRRRFRQRQPPLRQGEFQFRPHVPHRARFITTGSRTPADR